jgi:hypothetical protein
MKTTPSTLVPRMSPMASGHLCIEFTGAVTWDCFPQFADDILNRIGAKVTQRGDAVDMKIWSIERGGVQLSLVYEDYPSQASLESPSVERDAQVRQIAELLAIPDSPLAQ